MRTNIVLDDTLVEEAFHYTTVSSKKELIHLALKEFVQNHKRRDIREIKGKVHFRKGYDHKALREGK